RYILITLITVGHCPHSHDPYIIRYSFDTFIIVPDCANNASHMGTMLSIRAGNIIIPIKPLVAVGIIISNRILAWVEFKIQMICYLGVKVLHPFVYFFPGLFIRALFQFGL